MNPQYWRANMGILLETIICFFPKCSTFPGDATSQPVNSHIVKYTKAACSLHRTTDVTAAAKSNYGIATMPPILFFKASHNDFMRSAA